MFLQKNKNKFIKSYFMNLAFNLANIHNNMTGINPSVGCLVCKNDKILSYGVTGVGGSPGIRVTRTVASTSMVMG